MEACFQILRSRRRLYTIIVKNVLPLKKSEDRMENRNKPSALGERETHLSLKCHQCCSLNKNLSALQKEDLPHTCTLNPLAMPECQFIARGRPHLGLPPLKCTSVDQNHHDAGTKLPVAARVSFVTENSQVSILL